MNCLTCQTSNRSVCFTDRHVAVIASDHWYSLQLQEHETLSTHYKLLQLFAYGTFEQYQGTSDDPPESQVTMTNAILGDFGSSQQRIKHPILPCRPLRSRNSST